MKGGVGNQAIPVGSSAVERSDSSTCRNFSVG